MDRFANDFYIFIFILYLIFILYFNNIHTLEGMLFKNSQSEQ